MMVLSNFLCYAGDTDIQDFAPAQNVFAPLFIIITRGGGVHTNAPCSAAFI